MRNLCCKCPHYYSEQSYDGEYDWGCRVFGRECHSCPSFWDDEGEADESEMGCNVHPKQMDFLLMRDNRRLEAWTRQDSANDRRIRHHSGGKEEKGYKALDRDDAWCGYWTTEYRPNRKGGHRHNHIYNVCHRITFRSKSARHRVSRKDKMMFVDTFYTTLMFNPQVLGDILKRRKA